MTTKWIRQRPHWKGVYISKLGRITKRHTPFTGWLFMPAKAYHCDTLKKAKELAEEMQP